MLMASEPPHTYIKAAAAKALPLFADGYLLPHKHLAEDQPTSADPRHNDRQRACVVKPPQAPHQSGIA